MQNENIDDGTLAEYPNNQTNTLFVPPERKTGGGRASTQYSLSAYRADRHVMRLFHCYYCCYCCCCYCAAVAAVLELMLWSPCTTNWCYVCRLSIWRKHSDFMGTIHTGFFCVPMNLSVFKFLLYTNTITKIPRCDCVDVQEIDIFSIGVYYRRLPLTC